MRSFFDVLSWHVVFLSAFSAVGSAGCGTGDDKTTDTATAAGTDGAATDTASADAVSIDTAAVDADAVAETAPPDTSAADVTTADTAVAETAGAETSTPDVAADVAVAPAILDGPSRGSAVAVSSDDKWAVACNRDSGSVSVFSLAWPDAKVPTATKVADVDLGAGSEPWQVAIAPDSKTAYVVLRHSQKLVRVALGDKPAKNGEVATGSEPTAVALSPTGAWAFVANWVDGTVQAFATADFAVKKTIDLNAALAASGLLGTVKARPALAHPRSLAVTNDGDADDADEALLVTEYFGQQLAEEKPDGANGDAIKQGIVYKVTGYAGTTKVDLIKLAPLADLGFKDQNGGTAGCFPNQLQAIAIHQGLAYVTSLCASPKGPIGPFTGPANKACTADAECPGAVVGSCAALKCTTTCAADADCGANGGKCTANKCEVNVASAKTAIGNVVSVIDIANGKEIPASAVNLNAKFNDLYVAVKTDDNNTRRLPLVMTDIAFVPGLPFGYVTANGADAVFRFGVDVATGAVTSVGSNQNAFIDLSPAEYQAKDGGKGPIGLAIPASGKKFAFVLNEFTRNLQIIDFAVQQIAGGAAAASVVGAAAMPADGSDAQKVLKGKRFFNTGLGRWSLKGQAWNACQTCHTDGLTDNVTWYFARGPRQSTSLDGSFNSKDAKDQRIFNWTAVFDEVADFELNTRGVSGGVGAIVSKAVAPIGPTDRIDIAALGHAGLNGSAAAAADPKSAIITPPSVLEDWAEVTKYVASLRSPRGATGIDATKAADGKKLFQEANCAGCHGGPKWTISKMFYQPSVATNTALKSKLWAVPQYFPKNLLPAETPANFKMRFDSGDPAALDQLLCILRPVGTFGVAEPGVGVAEIRANMKALAQGNEKDGKGYNPPSLLGVAAGAPYLHAGQARTLESLLSKLFEAHHIALAANFLQEIDGAKKADTVEKLVHYLLTIDEGSTVIDAPATAGQGGGDFCAAP